MFRLLVLISLLIAPVASAGVSASTDLLPNPTSECNETEANAGESYGWHSNTSYYYSGWYARSASSECSSNSDLARAEASSNGHDAASARVGDGWSQEQSESESSQGSSSAYWDENHTRAYGWSEGYSYRDHRDAYSSGREARVDTFAGNARSFEGCSGNSQGYGSNSYNSWFAWDGNSSSGNYNDQGWSGTTYSSNCEYTVTLENGVTTVRAGQENPCDSSSYAGYYRSWNYGDSSSSSGEGSYHYWMSECASEYFAQAGSERAAVGSRSDCWGHGSSWSDGGPVTENSTNEERHTYQTCASKFGVFGPDGFGVYVRDDQQSSEHCRPNEGCDHEETSWRAVGAEHDLVGGVFFTLP